jgi:thiol-disulfide isomerase/thioredoxin
VCAAPLFLLHAVIASMKLLRFFIAALVLGAALAAAWPSRWAAANTNEPVTARPAPEFVGAGRWFNSPPLTMSALRGKVVLVEFWTRECINCVHVLPHTKALYDRYRKDGLVVIGVHTPEFDEERDPAGVEAAIRQFGIDWPVVTDNGYGTWNAFGNGFWPALYLIDRDGRIVYRHVGEGGYDATEQRVRQLLGKA